MTANEASGTETESLEAEASALEAELARVRELLVLVLDHNPHAIAVASPDGSVRLNRLGTALLGPASASQGPDAKSAQLGLFREDQRTPYPSAELPLARATTGREIVRDAPVWARSAARPQGAWLAVSAAPLPFGAGVAVFRDVTQQRHLADDLKVQSEAIEDRARVNRELVDRLRLSLDELSTPVLELWDDVLVVPVIGLLDTQRSARMNDRVLDEVATRAARFVIMDLTGVELVDTSTADRLIKIAASVRLLGSECVVSGIQPAVAQTLVSLGVELDELVTCHNLEHALVWCLRREQVGQRVTRSATSTVASS